ncbi:hypothetical protein D3C80_900370 [compost metagenome]
MVVVEVDASVRTQAEGQGRCNTPAVVVDAVTPGDVALVAQQVQTASGGVGELVVAVEGVALGLVGTPGETTVERIAQVRFLADQVDAAACCATAADRGVRAFADFNRFNGEDLAALGAGIAHAVQIGVALGVEAADERTVALRITAFTGTEGDAWNSAQRVLQVERTGVFQDLLRNNGHRARCVDQRRGVLGRGGFLYVVACLVLGFAGDGGGAQRNHIVRCFPVGFFRRENHVARRAGSNRHADGRCEQTW